MNLKIQKIDNKDEVPFNLLLLADETLDAIYKYVFQSEVFIANHQDELIAVFCLYPVDESTIELKNIAVVEHCRSKGFGSRLIDYIKSYARGKYRRIVVGTAAQGWEQIRFYERNGFVKYGVRKDFFLLNYDRPIIENGIQLRDMVMLEFFL
jgi:ribosomal protein S18 acetylase RimI-like enzyme